MYAELLVEMIQTRQSDLDKLFTMDEVELMITKFKTTNDPEALASNIIDLWNKRVAAYNERAYQYNISIINGTHPALGPGFFNGLWSDFKGLFSPF